VNRIVKYVILDILRNKIVVAYTVLLALISWSAFGLEDNSTKGTLTVLNIILLTVPLVSVLFSTIYLYNCNEFIELLVSQPLTRTKIWMSLFMGLSFSLILAFLLGAGIPVILNTDIIAGFMIVGTGILISVVFIAIAFTSTVLTHDKAKGIGISVLCWLYFAILFDGIILFLLFQFADYPIEKIVIIISIFSPVDIARILILLQLDVSAMLGYTGALFKEVFAQDKGMILSFCILLLWIVIPFTFSLWKFKAKDL